MRASTPSSRRRAIARRTELPGEVVHRRLPRQLRAALRGHPLRASSPPASSDQLLALIEIYVGRIAPGHAEVRLDEVRGTSPRPTSPGWAARRRQRLLLPRAQPGHPHRVRPPGRHRVRQQHAVAQPHPHHRAHAERQRLREGPAAAALRAAPPAFGLASDAAVSSIAAASPRSPASRAPPRPATASGACPSRAASRARCSGVAGPPRCAPAAGPGRPAPVRHGRGGGGVRAPARSTRRLRGGRRRSPAHRAGAGPVSHCLARRAGEPARGRGRCGAGPWSPRRGPCSLRR